ncbi:1814_t:CDS:2 [Acaulospora colombiana]|uniref:1814_t:CDS:1 n=1 Tax=Acaulospora colombiana TaxID=27376 RepID=A0ACA9KWV8_9GLOM|nr:1814_t:CDS:2 [Acaulospora colombiana]
MADDDDFAPSQTTGYKVGEKKSIDEYKMLDANDESLNKWKESLGLNKVSGKGICFDLEIAPVKCLSLHIYILNLGATSNGPRVVILQLALEVSGRDDVVLDLSSPGALEHVKNTPFVIKEGVEYRMKVKFRIQDDVVSGLKYLQVVKRKGIRVDKTEEMIGSYGPSETPYEKKFLPEEAPSGLLARGHYEAKSKFIDDDGKSHIEWSWCFDIKKDWD